MEGKAQETGGKGGEGPETAGELERKLEEKTREAEDYLTRLKYLQADFENYRKQVEKEREELARFATEPLVRELIEVLENLERAVASARKTRKKDLVKGIELIYARLKEILEKEGLEPIPALGEKCDPYKHEVLLCETRQDCREDEIIEELQRGYTLRGKVIRYAKVKVAKRGD
ncbi:MAG: nucleotide exchange factor GrpE [Euryarchaeota archaeon]|nr:nucleotide exchange factor GrpE [Euryarchaeota archaeon]